MNTYDYRVTNINNVLVAGSIGVTGGMWGPSDAGFAGFYMGTGQYAGGAGLWYAHYDAIAD